MPSGYDIPLPEEVAEKLSSLPFFSQQVRFEHAINQALDDAGWPKPTLEEQREQMRREMGEGAPYYYVTVYQYGRLRGHVGPIPSKQVATLCAQSWRQSGARAKVDIAPVGPAMTNAY